MNPPYLCACCEDSGLPSVRSKSGPARGRPKDGPATHDRAAQPPSLALPDLEAIMLEIDPARAARFWGTRLVLSTAACKAAENKKEIFEKHSAHAAQSPPLALPIAGISTQLYNDLSEVFRARNARYWYMRLSGATAAWETEVEHRNFVKEQYEKSLRRVAELGLSTASEPRAKRAETITSGKGKSRAR